MRLAMQLRPRVAATLLAAAVAAGTGNAQEAKQPLRAERQPRILLIGDSSLSNHLDRAAAALKDEATVVRSPLGHVTTGAALERLDEILQRESWDLICFHFGLSDLMFRDPRSKQVRAMSPAVGGVPATVPEDYSENLGLVVERLRATGDAKLLWITSVPLHPSRRSAAIEEARIGQYDARARQVMDERAVPIFDAHAQVTARLAEAPDPRSLDRFHNQLYGQDLSGPLVDRIRGLLRQPPKDGAPPAPPAEGEAEPGCGQGR